MSVPPESDHGAFRASERNGASHGPAITEGDATDSDPAEANPLEPLIKQLAELREFALHYVTARKDSIKLAGERMVIQAAIFGIAGILATVFLATSLVLLLSGISQLVGQSLGNRAGVGEVLVGGGTLLTVLVLGRIGLSIRNQRANQETKRKYERRHQAQRTRFGEDVAQRASS